MNHRPQVGPADPGAPELLICTRFGLRIRDRGWLQHRLALISSVTAPSLMAQDDRHFHWVVWIDDGLPADIRDELEEVVRPFGRQAFLHRRPHHGPDSLLEVAADRLGLEDHQFLLTGRIDDDDAWSTTMVSAARARTAAWLKSPGRAPGLAFSFPDGLEWVMYEMLDVERLEETGEHLIHPPAVRNYSLPFISTSVFVCSPLSIGGTAMSGAHSQVGNRLTPPTGLQPTSYPARSHCGSAAATNRPRPESGRPEGRRCS